MKLNLRKIRLTVIVIIIALLASGAGYWFGSHPLKTKTGQTFSENEKADLSLFWDVWERLGISFIDKNALEKDQMLFGAIKGMVAALGDPYTVFLPPSDNQQAKEDLNGSFSGVGIELGYRNQYLTVISPLSGMPAEKAGVKAGDLILKIDGEETTDISLPEAVKLIRGQKGTSVKLTLLHQNEKESYEATIIRDTIIVPSVEVKFESDLALLKLMRFGDRTTDEWHQAVSQIVEHQPAVKGIVFDLRNNPGGVL